MPETPSVPIRRSRILRRLIPHVSWGGWFGDAVEEGALLKGKSIMVEWLGLNIEVAVSRVEPWATERRP